jgi:hypothetical protein
MTDMATEKALALPGPVSSELAAMGSRKEVRELVRRIQTQAPGGMKLTPAECVTLAQYSFSLGANPLVGEAWLLKNQRSGEVLGVMPGMALFRRRADEKDERTGDVRWLEPEVITDPDELERLGIPDDAFVALRMRLYRQSQTKAHSQAAKTLAEAGAPWNDIKEALGLKPYTSGLGWVTRTEMSQRGRGGPQEGPYQIAERRAEKHALKQTYSLPFGFIPLAEGSSIPDGATLEDYIHEGEFQEVAAPPPPPDTRTTEQKHEAGTQAAAALFDTEPAPARSAAPADPEPRLWDDATVKRAAEAWESTGVLDTPAATKHVIMLLNLSPFKPGVPDTSLVTWGRSYRSYREQGMTTKEAAALAKE